MTKCEHELNYICPNEAISDDEIGKYYCCKCGRVIAK